MSKGGAGGVQGGDGSPGTTLPPGGPSPAGADGSRGTNADCNIGVGNGRVGSNALDPTAGTEGAKVSGALTESGWTPEAGKTGSYGVPGQGGGGGGGNGVGGGGGGACGGCPGAGGEGGGGGGASVALLTFNSPVKLRDSALKSAGAGAGGAGAPGGDGIGGGTRGGSASACNGGNGGKGGNGVAGGGGAGGVSAAVLYKGSKPVSEGSSLAFGAKGAKGTGLPAANDGVETASGEMGPHCSSRKEEKSNLAITPSGAVWAHNQALQVGSSREALIVRRDVPNRRDS